LTGLGEGPAPPARPIRVAILINRFHGIAGAEQIAVEIAVRLDRERFRSTVWTSRPSKGPLLERLRRSGIPVHSLRRGAPWQLWTWSPFLRYLRDEKVDVLHAHGFGSNLWAAVWGRMAGVPVVIAHDHSWSFEGQILRKLLDRHVIARRTDVLLAVSREDRRRMSEIERISPDRTRYMPNGIPPFRAESGHDVRSELGIPGDAPVIGTVSVVRSEKRLDLLLEAVALLAREFPQLRLLVVGGGFPVHIHALESQAEALGLSEVVSFLGLRTDVADVVATFDVAVSSSRFEGSPLSLLEYMAAARPIVATRVGGVPDLIEDRISGLLVEPENAAALAAGIATLLRDRNLARKLGDHARERQQSEFRIEIMIQRIEDLYEALLRERRRHRP
jgi:glycosyltransferase involved in cell wall biosynthesis